MSLKIVSFCTFPRLAVWPHSTDSYFMILYLYLSNIFVKYQKHSMRICQLYPGSQYGLTDRLEGWITVLKREIRFSECVRDCACVCVDVFVSTVHVCVCVFVSVFTCVFMNSCPALFALSNFYFDQILCLVNLIRIPQIGRWY